MWQRGSLPSLCTSDNSLVCRQGHLRPAIVDHRPCIERRSASLRLISKIVLLFERVFSLPEHRCRPDESCSLFAAESPSSIVKRRGRSKRVDETKWLERWVQPGRGNRIDNGTVRSSKNRLRGEASSRRHSSGKCLLPRTTPAHPLAPCHCANCLTPPLRCFPLPALQLDRG